MEISKNMKNICTDTCKKPVFLKNLFNINFEWLASCSITLVRPEEVNLLSSWFLKHKPDTKPK